ncbi:MAG TPA: VIT domain-containing protein, partial [Verrucomicrobiae bacterium]|nr:VIT domain-containing protein [Verrucomicrobiae bacterium]
MKRWICSLLLLIGTISSGWSAGLIIVDEAYWPGPGPRPPVYPPPDYRPPWPRPVPPPRVYRFCPLELTFHQANVRIRDLVAVTSVEQEFYNPNERQIEGTFLFPVPKGAQIDKFSMEINGKQVEAELLSADKARQIYEDIVRKAKDPALLEYSDRSVFKVRIFPIEARGRKRVKLSWTQLLMSDSGLVSYAYPLNTEKFSAKPIPTVGLKIEIESKRPLKTIYSSSHNVEVRRHGDNKATIGYEAKDVKPDTDFQLFFGAEKDDLGVNLMTWKPDGEDGYFLLLVSPGADVKDAKVAPKDVVFVFDTSGSMSGKKIDQARKALLFCVENLNDADRFEIVRFSTETETVFGSLAEASKENRARAENFIKDLKATGGTAIDDALRKALSLRPEDTKRPYLMIFLTDGLPTVGVTSEDQIVGNVKKNSANTRIFCFGVGHDVNTHLLDKIAEETRAFSQYVLPEEDIEVKVSNFFAKIKDPVLVNPTLAFTGDIRVSKTYPSQLPDLFRGEQLIVAGRYRGQGDSAAVVEGMVNGVKRKLSYDVKFGSDSSEHDFIPRLWATRRVGYLLEQTRLHGENAELKDEITELARKYSIVTPYTAYLIVEDEARRGVPLAMQSMPRLQADAGAREATGEYYTRLMRQRYGLGAVTQSRSELAFKSANAPADAISAGGVEAQRGFAAAETITAPGVAGGRGAQG